MKKWIFATAVCFFLSFSSSVFASSDASAAKNVIKDWFLAMKNNQVDKAASFLAPQFMSIHTDRVIRNKTQEIDLIKNLHMTNYYLSHFKFSQSGDVIVVTYDDVGSEMIDNKPIATHSAGRMAILQKQDNQWLILAYANLDQIT